ncbi:MAG: DUF3566 domain-containing protein [Candidatus Nanopelagicales bacterium]|nr:DUF3566 domain-containing protein [Candidatus Nanopelagicales bacterium]
MTETEQIADVVEAPAKATGPRQARLRVSRVDPWSVMKTSFLLSLGLAIVVVVALLLIWLLLTAFGVFDSINKTVSDVAGPTSGIDVLEALSFGRVVGYALLLAVFEVVMTSVLATLVAGIYNATAGLTGGFELTLSED